ncbi:MAG: PAS domain-containing sensor histidine kinase [Gluconacetobacter diazotrophicus]|nr:PAS domain-containing sensor histidine kinase [Gluconacetobacter diazotrophicus]
MPSPGILARGGSLPRRGLELLLGRTATLMLAAIALMLGVATFAVLSRGMSLARRPHVEAGLFLLNLVVLAMLGAALAVRLGRVIAEHRRGLAGARLHVRLVMLFGVVAVVPTIVVGVFAAVFFHLGIQIWFNDRVRSALEEAVQASQGYLQEHNNTIRADAIAMANDLAQVGPLQFANPAAVSQLLQDEGDARGLSEAAVFNPNTGTVLASGSPLGGLGVTIPPTSAAALVRPDEPAVLDSRDGQTVSALAQVGDGGGERLMLVITRPVDPTILSHMRHTQDVVTEYGRLDHNRSALQATFVVIFALVALLVLAAAALIGLVLANQIARPVGRLMLAAERVSEGDLAVQVPETERDDELAGLSRAFNRMTGQLGTQRGELLAAYGQINERRRFTEAVLSGVSAGVIGLDAESRVELPNRAASALLGIELTDAAGRRLAELVPDFAPLLAAAAAHPERAQTAELQHGAGAARRTLLVRIGPEMRGAVTEGYVVTFDDITELQAAQRKAAWADVARRIAHEIKNPLTPIQLSAERLKRRFGKEITSDPETFTQCADTIVRHVGDIGRMVDEFSAFARMPQPVIKPDNLGRIVREALVLQKGAHPEIRFDLDLPADGPVVPCDRRLLGQALTNLIQNAADGIAMRPRLAAAGSGETGAEQAGTIWLRIEGRAGGTLVSVADDGVGLPQQDRHQLTEPYVTHKPKGTGLGLAIVKKIMEDHGGTVVLDDRPGGMGAIATLILPGLRSGSSLAGAGDGA